jgi:hypothetical protein
VACAPDGPGRTVSVVSVVSPYANARHVLAITYQAIPKLSPAPEVFMFYGGFDPHEIMTNPKEAGFLAFLYPLSEADKARERLGSVDYTVKA